MGAMDKNTDMKNYVEKNFTEYVAWYDITDAKIRLKKEHTYCVAALCREIAVSIKLSEADCELAWLCGMLHDIGRFEQVKRFGTFLDSESVDHAQFGADLLFKEGLWEKIVPEDMDSNKDLIEKAIRVHNVYRLPDELTEREYLFATILRDADKVDILRANCETPTEQVYNVTTEELKQSLVSEDVKQAFKERRCAKRHDKTTPVDHLVGHVCLTFELVYKRSVELMYEQGYLFRLMDFSSDMESTNAWFSYMREEMKNVYEELLSDRQ